MARRAPSTIGRYEILRRLGRGGMGTVYLGHDPELGRPVAIKLLRQGRHLKQDDPRKLRFLREALTTAQLQHPAIPPVYDVGQDAAGRIFYAMKPIEGRSLQSILDDLWAGAAKTVDEFDLFRLVEVLRDITQAVKYAHSKGCLHRDLKPSNIFVGDYGEVYVIDWGLTKVLKAAAPAAKAMASATVSTAFVEIADSASDETVSVDMTVDVERPVESDTLTLAGDVLGTVAYMPPEQATGGAAEVGPEADVYALGVILYEILTLRLPLEGRNLGEVVKAKKQGEIVPPELRAPGRDVPPELSATAMQAMSPDPEDRIRSAADFEKALAAWLEGKSQFRRAVAGLPDRDHLLALPKGSRKAWTITRDTLTTLPLTDNQPRWLLLDRELVGDVRFSVNAIAYPTSDTDDSIAEIGLVICAAAPDDWQGFVDGYTLRIAAGNNTRACIEKNDAEIVSNEMVVLEPRRRYRITFERLGDTLRVLLDRQVILFCTDRASPPGLLAGFIHRGGGVQYSNLRLQTRGQPTTTATINIPEALMIEGCYAGAYRRFLSIAQAHRNRNEGAWARYRAGMASYAMDKDRTKAMAIWRPLKSGQYAAYEALGRAMLELDKGHALRAARILQTAVDSSGTLYHAAPLADLALTQAQQLLRRPPQGKRGWTVLDAWCRLALDLGQRVEDLRPATPSILWRWLLQALTNHPDDLPGAMAFLQERFGRGQGAFAETLTAIEPLMRILHRSLGMADHEYLLGKVMRLILGHDDQLGNLETLARFYLQASYPDVALAISRHICHLCRERSYAVPAMPVALVGLMAWLRDERKAARKQFESMIERGQDWAPHDGRLLLGLDEWSHGNAAEAQRLWRIVASDADAAGYNRHLVARGLLDELPPDPVAAGVPARSDHRLLYSLFLGLRIFCDWKRIGDDACRREAVALHERVMTLVRPSYDVYSATDVFSRLVLEQMGCPLPPRSEAPPLSEEERAWLTQLTDAAGAEVDSSSRSGTSGRGSPSPRRGT